jgi:hypothetical protein
MIKTAFLNPDSKAFEYSLNKDHCFEVLSKLQFNFLHYSFQKLKQKLSSFLIKTIALKKLNRLTKKINKSLLIFSLSLLSSSCPALKSCSPPTIQQSSTSLSKNNDNLNNQSFLSSKNVQEIKNNTLRPSNYNNFQAFYDNTSPTINNQMINKEHESSSLENLKKYNDCKGTVKNNYSLPMKKEYLVKSLRELNLLFEKNRPMLCHKNINDFLHAEMAFIQTTRVYKILTTKILSQAFQRILTRSTKKRLFQKILHVCLQNFILFRKKFLFKSFFRWKCYSSK